MLEGLFVEEGGIFEEKELERYYKEVLNEK